MTSFSSFFSTTMNSVFGLAFSSKNILAPERACSYDALTSSVLSTTESRHLRNGEVTLSEPYSTSWLALCFRLIISFFVLGVQSIGIGGGKAKETMVGDNSECIA